MFTYQTNEDDKDDELPLNKTIGSSYIVDRTDVLNTKTALEQTGDYKAPEWGKTEFTDDAMFDGLKTFQKREGLQVDGVMKPGGPTAKRLGQRIREKVPQKIHAAAQPASKSAGARQLSTSKDGIPQRRKQTSHRTAAKISDNSLGLPERTGTQRDHKEETQVAVAPLIPLIGLGAAVAKQAAPHATRSLQNLLRSAPPLFGAAEEMRRRQEREDSQNRPHPPIIPQIGNEDGFENSEECEKLYYDIDIPTCRAINEIRGSQAAQRRYASASERYAACLRGVPLNRLPPLDTWNN